MRWRSVRAQRSVDRGRAGGVIEPRNSIEVQGADAFPSCGRQYCWRRYSRVAGGPCAVGDPRHARRAPCARTGRSRGRPRGVDDAPSWMVRGVADQRWCGPRGERLGGNPSMHDREKSDRLVVPAKPPNKPGEPGAEVVEGRGLPEGNTASETRPGRSAGQGVSSDLDRVRQVARKDGDVRFTALLHHVTRRSVAGGVSGDQPERRRRGRRGHVAGLRAGSRGEPSRSTRPGSRGAYRARPTRRVFIPKPDGRLRPLGVAALEDKIVQRAVVEVLNAIYEEDFLGFSYGFRPGRSSA